MVPSMDELTQTAEEDPAAGKAEIDFDRREQDTLLVSLSGSWKIGSDAPAVEEVLTHLQSLEGVRKVAFDSGGITGWDSSLLTFLMDLHAHCTGKGIAVATDGLPEGVGKLIALATAVPRGRGPGGRRSVSRFWCAWALLRWISGRGLRTCWCLSARRWWLFRNS